MTKLRIGLIGAGHIAGTHLRAWRRCGARLEGIFDRDGEAADRRAREFAIRAYDDAQALIGACDVVDVCTPPQSHAPIARQVVGAGKHLLIEKPIVTALADWLELRQLLTDSPSSLCVLHNLKYARGIRNAKRWLDQGRIGRPLRVQREFLSDPNGDRMLGGEGHWSHRLAGGRWQETLPHELYLVHHLIGPMELAEVVALSTPDAPAGVPADEVLVTLRHDRCLGSIHYSGNCRLNRRRLTLTGSEGEIHVDLLSDSAWLTRRRDRRWQRALGDLLPEGWQRLVRWIPDRVGYLAERVRTVTPHSLLIADFHRFLLRGGPEPTPLEEIDYVVRMSDAIGRRIEAPTG